LLLTAAVLAVAGPATALNRVGQAGDLIGAKLTLLYITPNANVNRTIYSYKLVVDDPAILHVNTSTLTLRDMAGVMAIGNAIGWRTDSFTNSTATWVYARQLPYRNYSTFDIEADNAKTTLGDITYHLDADEDTYGTVEGPVPIIAQPAHQISGTVFLDADGDGIFDEGEEIVAGVTLELRAGDGRVLATTTTGGHIYSGEDEYLGNYVFHAVLPSGTPGDYLVVVTDEDGVLVGLLPTTDTSQPVLVTTSDVREVDFGYASKQTRIWGRVFFDADTNGASNDALEMGFGGVEVALSGTESGTQSTDQDGYYDFGTRPTGTYSLDGTDGAYGACSSTSCLRPRSPSPSP